MTRKGRRLTLVGVVGVTVAVATGLILFALRDGIVFFYGPSEVAEKAPSPGTRLRVGGLVRQGSVSRTGPGMVSFVITDLKASVRVSYTGLLPDLFREGQGIVAEGTMEGPALLQADAVLAKHDERYIPKDVVDELKRQNTWRGSETSAQAR